MKVWEIRFELEAGITSTWTVAAYNLSGAIREAKRRLLDHHMVEIEPIAWKEAAR